MKFDQIHSADVLGLYLEHEYLRRVSDATRGDDPKAEGLYTYVIRVRGVVAETAVMLPLFVTEDGAMIVSTPFNMTAFKDKQEAINMLLEDGFVAVEGGYKLDDNVVDVVSINEFRASCVECTNNILKRLANDIASLGMAAPVALDNKEYDALRVRFHDQTEKESKTVN